VVPVSKHSAGEVEALEPFGDLIPFADPSWYQGVCPPPFTSREQQQLTAVCTVPLPLLQRNARRPPRRSSRMGHHRNRALRRRVGRGPQSPRQHLQSHGHTRLSRGSYGHALPRRLYIQPRRIRPG
jgi:hypothetical protein